jgi:regulator of ribonuclease activity A
MNKQTADLCDQTPAAVFVATPLFSDYGAVRAFCGQIATVKVHEDNLLVRQAIEEAGAGRVLVIDGGGSLRCALVGDKLAALAHQNGWAGLVVYGAIRDSRAIASIPIGVKALNTNPFRSVKKGAGDRDIAVTFAGVTFTPGHWLYADEDGIIVAAQALIEPADTP